MRVRWDLMAMLRSNDDGRAMRRVGPRKGMLSLRADVAPHNRPFVRLWAATDLGRRLPDRTGRARSPYSTISTANVRWVTEPPSEASTVNVSEPVSPARAV